MNTVKVEGLYKKFSSKLSDSVRSGIKEIIQSQKQRTDDSLLNSEFWALEDISFELDEGDALGILGANGSGKTTLLRVLNGTYKPTKGRIEMKEPIGSLIAAGAGFSPTLTGRENVFLSASLLGLSTKEIEKKYNSIVEFSELGDFLDMPLSHYSSGMSVRLAFSVATSIIPEVLLIDEVLAVGDIGFQRKCFSRIDDLKKAGTTFLIVSHSIESTWELCNKGMYMESGKSEGIEDVKNVIAKYVNSSILNQKSTKQNMHVSQISGEIDIVSISIQGDNNLAPNINFRNSLHLNINFKNRIKLEKSFVRINISNDKYRPIASADTSLHAGGIKDLEVGEHNLHVSLNEINLKPGRYSIDLSINSKLGSPHSRLFKDVLLFEIHASPENHLYDFGLHALIDLPIDIIKFK
jgi:lipopolysaccharide transport system ATP-binding protein